MKWEERTEKSLLPMKDMFLDSERGGGKKAKLDPCGFHIYSLISITHMASRHVWWFHFQGSYHICLHETQHHWLNLKHICPSEALMGNRVASEYIWLGENVQWIVWILALWGAVDCCHLLTSGRVLCKSPFSLSFLIYNVGLIIPYVLQDEELDDILRSLAALRPD